MGGEILQRLVIHIALFKYEFKSKMYVCTRFLDQTIFEQGNYRKVANNRPVYYSILDSLGQRSQYKYPLHKQSENPKMCY